jgi:nucleoside-diphosphate-sugar epimerase
MKYTVVGGKGFIGSKIVEKLIHKNEDFWIPEKNCIDLFNQELGIIIYCAGHGDCNEGFLKVLESNTILLAELLEKADFERLVYISSTRVYMGGGSSNEESNVILQSNDKRRLFNLSKLLSEELLLKSHKNVTIVRPSNTYGVALNSPLFLPSIVRDALDNGIVNMFVPPTYSKDYVSVDDVAEITLKIATDTKTINNIINIASGENVQAIEIAKVLEAETGCEIVWHDSDVEEVFPITDIDKIESMYQFVPKKVLGDLVSMINQYKNLL